MTRALLALLLPACAATYPGAAEDYAEAQRATVARERATADALQGVLHEIRDRPLVEPAALEAAVAALRAEASEASGTSRTERSRLQDASTAPDGRLGALAWQLVKMKRAAPT